MAGYTDGAISPAVEGSQGPSEVEYDYVDGGVVPEAPEADIQDYSEAEPDEDQEPAGETYRFGPLSDDEAARIDAGGDKFTTAE